MILINITKMGGIITKKEIQQHRDMTDFQQKKFEKSIKKLDDRLKTAEVNIDLMAERILDLEDKPPNYPLIYHSSR